MKDNLEDVLKDFIDEHFIDQSEDRSEEKKTWEVPTEKPSLEDLLGDVLSEIEIDEPTQEQNETITASEGVVDPEELEEVPVNTVPEEKPKAEPKAEPVQAVVKPKKKKPKFLRGFLSLLLVGAIAAGSWYVWDTYFNFKTVDVFEHIELIYTGSEGSASVDFEVLDFKDDVDDSVKSLVEKISFDFSKSEDLSNNDSITVTVKEDEELETFLKESKLKLDPLTKEFVVDGLVDASNFDVFLDTEITLEGLNGHASAVIENHDFKSYTEDEIKILKKIKYILDKDNDLSNDDVITVTVEVSDEINKELNNMNLMIEETSFEFTVSSLITSPESIDEVPDSEALESEALAKATADYEKQNQTYTNFNVEYACFTNDPQNVENYTDYFESHPYTGASLMYIISIENKTGTVGKPYFADNYGYTNIVVNEDGIDRDELKLMSPFQDFASTSEIKSQLELNGFKCTR